MITKKQLLVQTGKNLEQARIVRKLTQQELADRASVSRQTIANIEKGKPSVGLISVVWALSLEQNFIEALSPDKDVLGRSLAFGSLPSRVRGKKPETAEDEDFS